MFTIYTPNNSKFTADNGPAIQMLLTLPLIKDSLAVSVQRRAQSGEDLIVSRVQATDRSELQKVGIEFFDGSGAFSDDSSIISLQKCVAQWARHSNIRGTSGARIACVSELTRASGADSRYTMTAEVSTTVFYNARRVTVNVPQNESEFACDISGLVARLESLGAISDDSGIVISHPEFGTLTYGNVHPTPDLEARLTELRTLAGGLSNASPDKLGSDLEKIIEAARALQEYPDD